MTTFDEEKPVCCSGGAEGADLAWGEAALAAGHDLVHFVFGAHKSKGPNLEVLTDDQLAEAETHIAKANKTLRRRWPVRSKFVGDLLRRNYFQVRWSGALYAVSHLDDYGMVSGGTAWAVQMMIDLHPEGQIYLFDQKVKAWFQWKGAWMPSLQPPRPSGIYAGIGSRDLNDAGRNAIASVYN